ncbi:MAG: hypothetical protein MJZ66_09590 [Bacteroidales bacterium]|nr:hypothetical protein [Bacteroidales bacterium]
MTTAALELSAKREDLIKTLSGDDIDFSFIDEVQKFVQKLRKKREKEEVDYYESEQFYKDLDEAEEQIKRGECIKINTDEELRKLIYG